MANIENIAVGQIDCNPFRNTGTYPFAERKLDALKRSIEAVGLWEGVIGRKTGNRVQIAFGHHRVEAAKRSGLTEVPVILRDLSDADMLGFMGRENMEDYNSDFLTMLETWEAALGWLAKASSMNDNSVQPVEVAKLLGWTAQRTGGGDQMTSTSDACNSAASLIRQGLVKREDLRDLTVREAREICTRAAANIKRVETAAKSLGTAPKQVEVAKQVIAKAVQTTAEQSRKGEVAQKDLRAQVDVNAYRHAQTSKTKNAPLFDAFGKLLADTIAKSLKTDATAAKLNEVVKALGAIEREEDAALVRRLEFELGELGDRARAFQKAMVLPSEKVVPLKVIEKGEAK